MTRRLFTCFAAGGAICCSFVVLGALSAILYRPWRKSIDRKRQARFPDSLKVYDEDHSDNEVGVNTKAFADDMTVPHSNDDAIELCTLGHAVSSCSNDHNAITTHAEPYRTAGLALVST